MHTAVPITIGQTRDVLKAIRDASQQLVADLDDLAGWLTTLDLDKPTLHEVSEILTAAAETSVAADRALCGLNARHAAVEEAFNSVPRPAAGVEPIPVPKTQPVSFADVGRDERLEAMRAEIDAAMQRMADPGGWQAFLNSLAAFHRYSLNNTILALSQKPDATLLAGFKDWEKKHKRTVAKGAKAIWIYAPMTFSAVETDPEGGEERRVQHVKGFRPVPVFDVSQTEGKPLPHAPKTPTRELTGDAPAAMETALTDQLTGRGFALQRRPLSGGQDGYTNFGERIVVIDAGAAPRQQALTLAHELAHIALDHGGSTAAYHTGTAGRRSDMEIEAESVAYVLARHHGITDAGDNSFGYIARWARGDTAKVRETADRVLSAVRTILDYQPEKSA